MKSTLKASSSQYYNSEVYILSSYTSANRRTLIQAGQNASCFVSEQCQLVLYAEHLA